MYALATFDSGNYVFNLCSILERKGNVFEVVSTPCHIAKNGCGYCLKFPVEYKDMVIREGIANKTFVKEIYEIVPGNSKNKYVKIY